MRSVRALNAPSARRRLGRALPVLVLCGLVGCAGDEPTGRSAEAAAAALALFEVAHDPDAAADRLAAMFPGTPDADGQATLFDSLSALPRVTGIRVMGVELLEGLDRAVVDLAGDLAGGGTAHFSVQLAGADDEAWLVTWFMGPGVEWPRSRRRGPGLSSSPAE